METVIALWLLGATLVALGIAGMLLPALPGPPVLFAGLLVAAWAEDFQYVGAVTLTVLGVMAGLAYLVDFIASALGAKHFGASSRSAIGAAIGAVVGMFFGLVGILLGPFIGAILGELTEHDDVAIAGRAGVGATIGLLLGTAEGSVRLLRRLADAEALAPEAEGAADRPRVRAGVPRWLAGAREVLRHAGIAGALAALLLVAAPAAAQSVEATAGGDGSSLTLSLDGATDPDRISTTLQILLLMTVMSVAPSLLLVATSFTRIVIVLSLLRQAMGIHQLPPNQIIVGLALFTTFFVMAPVGSEIKENALDHYWTDGETANAESEALLSELQDVAAEIK